MVIMNIPDAVIEGISMSLNAHMVIQQEAVTAALTEANATIERQKSAMAAMEQVNGQQSVKLKEALETARAYDVLLSDTKILMDENRKFSAEIDRLNKLVGAPPVVVPVTPPAVKDEPRELAVTIVDNGSYGDALKSRLLDYLNHIAKSDIRRVILFQNKQQMIQDEFPRQLVDRGLQWDADTIWSVWRTTTPPERVRYVEMAERFKVQGFHADDAQNNTPEELADMVKFMRGYTDKPIYASFRADDTKILPDGKRVSFDMQAYKDAGLLITRQFFRQGEPTVVVDDWLKSGRITDGVNLEAFKEGAVTTSPAEFEMMFNKCLAAGVPFLSVYAVVESAKWQMWSDAPALWAMVNKLAAVYRKQPVKA